MGTLPTEGALILLVKKPPIFSGFDNEFWHQGLMLAIFLYLVIDCRYAVLL